MTNLRIGLLLSLIVVVAACSAGSARATPVPPGPLVTTPEQAVARVIAEHPRFAGIVERDPELIGQANWYEVMPASGVGAFLVTMRLGWGDCPAGCIDEHRWVFAVAPDGGVSLQSETGSDVPHEVWPSGDGPEVRTGVLLQALAGPTCPVETQPPDPACAPRPVSGATVRVLDGGGSEVASAVLDETGAAFIALVPGQYVIEPGEVEGLMGTPTPQDAVVVHGRVTPVALDYDTGIR